MELGRAVEVRLVEQRLHAPRSIQGCDVKRAVVGARAHRVCTHRQRSESPKAREGFTEKHRHEYTVRQALSLRAMINQQSPSTCFLLLASCFLLLACVCVCASAV